MKLGNVAPPSRVVPEERAAGYSEHHGHRTAISQRALQPTPTVLGWATLTGTDGPVGYVVSEVSPYEADLDWDEVTEPRDLALLVHQLGRATAKIHCVADSESDQDLVTVSVEDASVRCIGGTSTVSWQPGRPCPGLRRAGTRGPPAARRHHRGGRSSTWARLTSRRSDEASSRTSPSSSENWVR